MNRAERIFRLHSLLKKKRPPSMQQLMGSLEVSRPTLVRDIEYMRNFMDAPIQYDRTTNTYRYDPDAEDFELPGLWFNASELYALLATEQLLESVQPGFLTPHIGPLKTRIRSLLEQSGHSSELVSSRIHIRQMATRNMDNDRFTEVAGAVLKGQVLECDYHGRERNQITHRQIHPHQLLHYRDNWYLIGWCEEAKGLRTFSLDRINNIRILSEKIRAIDKKALDRYLGESFGIFTGPAKAWAVLRFSPMMSRWVADEQWHADQIGVWKGEAYELQVPYSDSRELLMDILKYGPEVEVIAPEPLRQLVAERLNNAARVYME